MSRSDSFLFSDMFVIKDIDKDGKAFDRVSRLNAQSDNYGAELTLDFQCELYPLKTGERFTLTLTKTLALDASGAGANGTAANTAATTNSSAAAPDSWRDRLASDDRDLSDEYDYVCHGRCYKFEEEANQAGSIYISFGGLLLRLKTDQKHLQVFTKGENVYLLMRK